MMQIHDSKVHMMSTIGFRLSFVYSFHQFIQKHNDTAVRSIERIRFDSHHSSDLLIEEIRIAIVRIPRGRKGSTCERAPLLIDIRVQHSVYIRISWEDIKSHVVWM